MGVARPGSGGHDPLGDQAEPVCDDFLQIFYPFAIIELHTVEVVACERRIIGVFQRFGRGFCDPSIRIVFDLIQPTSGTAWVVHLEDAFWIHHPHLSKDVVGAFLVPHGCAKTRQFSLDGQRPGGRVKVHGITYLGPIGDT